jgi:peptidoglycan/xylan/chitin deacetylase (PgdA/CDA1 family)
MNELRETLPRVLAYHEIAEGPSNDVYCITPQTFMSHLWIARQAAWQCRPPCITFDDGHRSHVKWAGPLLQSLGIQGQFFIPTAWIGTQNSYAGWRDLRQLAEQGHYFGSHGATHCFLEEELRCSRRTLEDKIGRPVTSISMPGGRWNEEVLLACGLAGYREVYTSEPGMFRSARTVNNVHLPAVIGRFAVRRKTRLRTVASYMGNGHFTVTYLRGMYQFRQLVRHVIGNSGYQQIWSSWFRAMPN